MLTGSRMCGGIFTTKAEELVEAKCQFMTTDLNRYNCSAQYVFRNRLFPKLTALAESFRIRNALRIFAAAPLRTIISWPICVASA